MKNKESVRKGSVTTKLSKNKIEMDEVKRQLTSSSRRKSIPKASLGRPESSKTQMQRLKNFYNTTRWLPNSAFTTFFGKPAFENYGYGNTNPVYGGLFYGNYMLTHNMNPIDGQNNPPEKQVYSSAMMKSLQKTNIRKPEPPRKTPDEIRNTPVKKIYNSCK
jgi:hypothetical protein